ncbi:hypothetical protein DSM104299_04167 [Baekduia alba]|nr:hypothetical protein DSM104299_04167 [Baekduia alba]
MALIRRHREWLQRTFAEQLGYELRMVDSSCARLIKRFDLVDARPLARAARSKTEQQRPVDERSLLNQRTIGLLCLCCAVLETTQSDQLPLGELAEQIQREARELDLPDLDWTHTPTRDALADAVGWLVDLGVLAHRAGQAGRMHTDATGEEAFYDIVRARLPLLLADPSTTAAAEHLHLLVAEPVHPPTEAGRRAALRHHIVRRLVEDPVVYRRDQHGVSTRWHVSSEEDEAWAERRQAFERAGVALTGLDREARLEGTALIASGREHTDRPFPTDANIKQLALLLIPELCAAALGDEPVRRSLPAGSPQIDRDIALDAAARLMAEHHGFWKAWEPDDSVSVTEQTTRALGILAEVGLVDVRGDQIRVLPAAHRYAAATAAVPQLSLDIADA